MKTKLTQEEFQLIINNYRNNGLDTTELEQARDEAFSHSRSPLPVQICSKCHRETKQIIGGLCPDCYRDKLDIIGLKRLERQRYQSALRRGEISLTQLGAGLLDTPSEAHPQ